MMKILIVEDSVIYRALIEKYIQKYLFFAKTKSISTFEELKNLKEDFDLYLVDYILPDANGEQIDYLLEKKKKVIVLTQYEKEFIHSKYKDEVINYVIKDDVYTIDYLVKFINRYYKNKNINVLIAEDSTAIRKREKFILEQINLKVYEANNGKEALEILSNNHIDLIISDINMPYIDGEKFLLKVREKHSSTDLPFIVISSENDNEHFIKLLKLGANDYLKKPFLKDELVVRVNNILDIYERMKTFELKAKLDGLTGVFNRSYLENELDRIFSIYSKKSIAMLDIDFFKKINDTYGHQIGDEILKHFANTIKSHIRKTDIIIRYGGEEFLIFMPNTTKQEAYIVLHKIKNILAKEDVNGIKYTFSAGIADEGETLAEMIKLADKRLYKAKKEGRNKIIIK